MKYKNLTIIGTSHVSSESVKQIENVLNSQDFSVVAIELDKRRLYSLLNPSSENKITFSLIKKVGFKGFLFAYFGKILQDKVGKKLGVVPGSDMLQAYKSAKKKDIKVSLIDDDIENVLKKISKSMRFKEKWRLFFDIIIAFLFPKKVKTFDLDLSKVPPKYLIDKMILDMKEKYPGLYKVLVYDRNKLMARRIYRLMKKEEQVLAVVGAGHEEEIISLVDDFFSRNTDIL